jgi:hypothetical protein
MIAEHEPDQGPLPALAGDGPTREIPCGIETAEIDTAGVDAGPERAAGAYPFPTFVSMTGATLPARQVLPVPRYSALSFCQSAKE